MPRYDDSDYSDCDGCDDSDYSDCDGLIVIIMMMMNNKDNEHLLNCST